MRWETAAFVIAVPASAYTQFSSLGSNTTLTGQKVVLCASATTFLNSCLNISLLQKGKFYFTYNGNLLFIETQIFIN